VFFCDADICALRSYASQYRSGERQSNGAGAHGLVRDSEADRAVVLRAFWLLAIAIVASQHIGAQWAGAEDRIKDFAPR
jgi:hypothetical protein